MEKLGIALTAVGFASAIALWIYGIFCYVQMVRHRAREAHPFQVAWGADQLTPRGREFRRRALRAYALFAVLAVALLLLTKLLSHFSSARGAAPQEPTSPADLHRSAGAGPIATGIVSMLG